MVLVGLTSIGFASTYFHNDEKSGST